MIVEGLLEIICDLIIGLLSGFNALDLDLSVITALLDVIGYGVYIIGGDLLLWFAGCVFAWTSFKFVAGLVVFLWKLLPLT